jgi:hypothetical protein
MPGKYVFRSLVDINHLTAGDIQLKRGGYVAQAGPLDQDRQVKFTHHAQHLQFVINTGIQTRLVRPGRL